MTAEPWYPIPPDEPYDALGDASPPSHGGVAAGGASPSASTPAPRATSQPGGALDLTLKYDRPPHRIREDRVRGADKENSNA